MLLNFFGVCSLILTILMMSMLVSQECEQELTQKGEMVSRLQAKTIQIGNLLSGLQKCNGLKDAKGLPLTLPLISPTIPPLASCLPNTPTGSNKASTPSGCYKVAPIPPWDGSNMKTSANAKTPTAAKAITPSKPSPALPQNDS